MRTRDCVGVQRAIDRFEQALEGERLRLLRGNREIEGVVAAGEEFLEPRAAGERAHRPPRGEHRDRHHRGARPLREIVDTKRKPRGRRDQLGRQVRRVLPRPHPDHREPVAREHADLADAAVREDPVARPAHLRELRVHAHGAERRVDLDRGVDVAGRRVVEDFPRSVGPLPLEERSDEPVAHRERRAEDVARQKPLRLHARVRLDHPDPESAGLLSPEEPLRTTLERPSRLIRHECRANHTVRWAFTVPSIWTVLGKVTGVSAPICCEWVSNGDVPPGRRPPTRRL
jgi:hypothetical protein